VVERVHRLPDLEVDVVGDVDEVADRPDTGGMEAGRHPRWRVRHLHFCHRGRVARAEFLVLDRHLNAIGRAEGDRLQRHLRARVGGRQRDRLVVRGGDLAREAEHAQAVGAVRRDLEIDHRIAIVQLLDGRDLESAQAYLLGNLFRGRRHIDELTEPRQHKTHR
jgi:hypothetical protein